MATITEQRREMDWVVVRNRTRHIEARNSGGSIRRSERDVQACRLPRSQGLSERVIYRELFPSGLTLLDKGHLGELGTSHLVARQELRGLLSGLNLPMSARAAECGDGLNACHDCCSLLLWPSSAASC